MSKTIQEYFQNEMQLLNESMGYFAQQHPDAASRMHLDSYSEPDPHIERLLEGCAYLTARVRQQIDLGAHHLSEAVLRRVAPDFLSPQPSMTIIEFISPNHCLTQSEKLSEGTKLVTDPIGEEQTICEFKTLQDLAVHPMRLSHIEFNSEGHSFDYLKLNFEVNEGVQPSDIDVSSMPLYINSPNASATAWHYHLSRNVSRVYHIDDADNQVYLGGQALVEAGALPSACSNHQFGSMKRLRHFIHFPEGELFIQLQFPHFQVKTRRFSLLIELSKSLSELRVHDALFKLHCVPAINQVVMTTEPIHYQVNRCSYPISVSHGQPQSLIFCTMNRVIGVSRSRGNGVEIKDLYKTDVQQQGEYYHRLSQSFETKDFIRSQLNFMGNLEEATIISCEVTACNGHYPRQFMNVNDLYLNDHRITRQLKASNLVRPSRFGLQVLDGEHITSLLSGLQADLEQWSHPQFLKRMFYLMDERGHLKKFIDAVTDCQLKPSSRICQGSIQRVLHFELYMNLSSTLALAEVNLLGGVLHSVLKHAAPVNHYLETSIIVEPLECKLKWGSNG